MIYLDEIAKELQQILYNDPDVIERMNHKIRQHELNSSYYLSNKEMLRYKYPGKYIIIYNKEIMAVSDSSEGICEKWVSLIDKEERFVPVVAYVPKVNGIFL